MNPFSPAVCLSAALALACAPISLAQASPAPIAPGQAQVAVARSAGLLDPQAVSQAARAVTAKAYPNADDVLVEDLARVEYRADGTATRTEETWVKVLTEKGRRDDSVATFSYNIFYDAFKVWVLEVHKPDGRVVRLDPAKQGKEMVDDASAGANIYDPADKRLSVSIPDLEIGDMVRIVTRQEGKHPRIAGVFSDMQMLESASPVLHSRYEVSGPADMPLKAAKVLDAAGTTVTESAFERSGRAWRAWDALHVAQFFPEPGMPDAYACTQRVAVSTAGSWQDISKWYHGLCADHLNRVTPAMREKVKEITAASKDREDKIRRIYRFVSQDIRYMGVTDESCAPGYEPHDVSLTFGKRYGVCRDKAALLVALLNLAGEKAFPVLIMVGPRLPVGVPAPMFNHAITALLESDGSYRLLDSTNENSAVFMPEYLQNCSFLVARPGGETLRVTPVPPAEANLVECATHGKLQDDGTLAARVDMKMGGINDNAYRNMLAPLTPDAMRQYFEVRLKKAVPGAQLTALSVQPENIRDITHPLTVHIEFKTDDALAGASGKSFLKLPWFKDGFGVAGMILAGNFGLEKRRFPLALGMACGVRETFELEWPGQWGKPEALPAPHVVDSAEFRFSQQVALDGGVLKGRAELLLRQPEVSPAGYLKIRGAMGLMRVADQEEPIFAGIAPASPSARVISDRTRVEIKDAHTWTTVRSVRKEILTYGGKQDAGEIRVPYNPAWDKVTLRHARVIAKDGKVSEISAKEINVLDAPWVAEAPRYPAGKILVASLPSLEIGSVVETEVAFEHRDRPFVYSNAAFAGSDPCNDCRYEAAYPASLPVKVDDHANGQSTPGSYAAAHAFEGTFFDSGMAPEKTFAPHCALSTGNAGLLGREVAQVVEKLGDGGAVVRAKAKDLVGHVSGGRAQVVALRDFVAKTIRSAGPALDEMPLSALSRPETVLADAYGCEADRAILLHALLSQSRIPSRLALACSSPLGALDMPSQKSCLQGDFYNMLVCIATLDGQDVMLDDLSQYAQLGASPLDGCPILELDGRMRVLHVADPFRQTNRAAYDIQLAPDGSALIGVSLTYAGAAGYRGFCQGMTELRPEDRRRQFHEMLSHMFGPDAQVETDFKYSLGYPAQLTFAVRSPHFAVANGDRLYFDLPNPSRTVSHQAKTDKRRTPMAEEAETSFFADWHVTPPQGYAMRADPPDFRWQGPGGFGSTRVFGEKNGQVIDIHEAQVSHPAIVQPAEYPSLVEASRQLERACWRVLLEK